MSALTTNTTIKGSGFKFNVRSYRLERVIDFTMLDFTASTYFEIGDLPAGFVPRAIGILELKKQVVGTGGDASAATLGVYLKSDSSKLVERTLGTAEGNTFALMTAATSTSTSGDSSITTTTTLAPVGVGGTLALYVNAKPTTGKVKVVVSGDIMAGVFDEGEKRDAYDEAEHVRTNKIVS